jgi:hypothetical protein
VWTVTPPVVAASTTGGAVHSSPTSGEDRAEPALPADGEIVSRFGPVADEIGLDIDLFRVEIARTAEHEIAHLVVAHADVVSGLAPGSVGGRSSAGYPSVEGLARS